MDRSERLREEERERERKREIRERERKREREKMGEEEIGTNILNPTELLFWLGINKRRQCDWMQITE